MRTKKEKWHKLRIKGLRRRWLKNTGIVIGALGIVCVLAITALFAAYFYSATESNLCYFAHSTSELFSNYMDLEYDAVYRSCLVYADEFESEERIQLQFYDAEGNLIVSSRGGA